MGLQINMSQKSKIKITDDTKLRKEIFEHYEKINQLQASKWALEIAIHILEKIHLDNQAIQDNIQILKQWQEGNKTTAQVREAALAIHQQARATENEIEVSALRTLGHAIASGHMKEHALIASDYAIQCTNKITNNDIQISTEERVWQLEKLKFYFNEK